MVEMVKIVHSNYDKISDVCMYLDPNYVLKFNVELHRKTKNNNIRSYHSEVGYTSNSTNQYCVNINRDFRYYFSIESLNKPIGADKRLKIVIDQNDIYFLLFNLHKVVEWFTSEQFKSLFVKDGNKIFIPVRVENVKCVMSFNTYLEFEPVVIENDKGEQFIGVLMFLNNDGVNIFLPVNMVLTLYDFLNRFNMFQSAQIMINYLGRPDYGTNLYDIDTGTSNESVVNSKSFNGVGFFDRVKAVQNE